MLTPAFEISQDEDFITIIIKARFAKVTETETYIDGAEFKFYSKPYFLRLNLPGKITEDGREKAEYNVDKGWFVMKFPKASPAEHFEGLDMLTKLLAPKGQRTASEPGIQLVGDTGNDAEEADCDEINWEVDQQPYFQDEGSLTGNYAYGFGNRRSGIFERLQEELQNIVDLPDPDHSSVAERKTKRREAELEKFDDDHYLADLYQDDMIQHLLQYKPSWEKTNEKIHREGDEHKNEDKTPFFTEEEKEQMRKLPNKEYILEKTTETEAYLGLVDIIYAYSYNSRTTEEENCIESAWTICKLSSTLSWLDSFTSLHDVISACLRRSLCYPLYRNWELSCKVLDDVKSIFKLGRSQLLRCFLHIHRILAKDEPHYILNDLYITDYCVWIQSVNESAITSLSQSLDKVSISKEEVKLDLLELEAAAKAIQEEEDEDDEEKICVHGYPHSVRDGDAVVEEQGDLITVLHEIAESSDESDAECSKDCVIKDSKSATLENLTGHSILSRDEFLNKHSTSIRDENYSLVSEVDLSGCASQDCSNKRTTKDTSEINSKSSDFLLERTENTEICNLCCGSEHNCVDTAVKFDSTNGKSSGIVCKGTGRGHVSGSVQDSSCGIPEKSESSKSEPENELVAKLESLDIDGSKVKAGCSSPGTKVSLSDDESTSSDSSTDSDDTTTDSDDLSS